VNAREVVSHDAAVEQSHFPVTETARMYKRRFPKADQDAIEAHIFLGSVGIELSQRLNSFLLATGWSVTSARYSILRLLYLTDEQQLTQSEIARRLRYTRGNITQLVDGLVGQGLVERIPSEASRRVTLARLTTKGQACSAKLVPAMVDFMERTCAALSKDEMDELSLLLGKFLEGLRCAAAD